MATGRSRFRAVLATMAMVVAGFTVLAQSPAQADVRTVSGSAFVATVRSATGVDLPTTPGDVEGSATEPQDAYGPIERSGPSLSVPGVLSAQAYRARTAGAGLAGENHLGSATSSTRVEDLELGDDALSADIVASSCRSDGNGSVAETVLTHALAGGNPLPVRPEANTQIVVPGVLTAILNEQVANNERGVSTSVTVTALHVQLLPTAAVPQTRDIVIGRSICLAAGPDVLVPTTTSAPPPSTTTTVPTLAPKNLVAVHSNKLLDVFASSTADGAAVIQWSGHGGDNQRWRLTPAGDGVFTIAAVHSSKVLDVEAGSLADGARVIQWAPHGGPNQLWRTEPAADGEFTIVAVHSGKLLDVSGGSTEDGAGVIQWQAHGGPNQRWRLANPA